MQPAPFSDLKVLDLAWVVAGPVIGRVLADYRCTLGVEVRGGRPNSDRAMSGESA